MSDSEPIYQKNISFGYQKSSLLYSILQTFSTPCMNKFLTHFLHDDKRNKQSHQRIQVMTFKIKIAVDDIDANQHTSKHSTFVR